MNSQSNELEKKSIIHFSGSMIGNVLSMLYLLLITRLLGKTIYGDVTYFLTFMSVINIFTQLGLGNVLISFLASEKKSKTEKKGILFFCLFLSFSLALLATIVCFVFRFQIVNTLLNSNEVELFVLLLPSICLDSVSCLTAEALRSQRLIVQNVFARSILMPIEKNILFILLFYFAGVQNHLTIIIPMFVGQFLSIVYALKILHNHGLLGYGNFRHNIIPIINFALPVLFTSVISIVMSNTDKYMIGYMINTSEVAVYNVALTAGGISSLALSSINSIFAPLIAKLYSENDMVALRDIYVRATKWVTILNILIFGVVLLYATEIMSIAGQEFALGAWALIIVCLGQIVNCIVGSVGYLNIMTGYPKYNMYSNFIAVILNVVCNFFMIPMWGINGAAIATALALATHNICNFVFMYGHLHMHPYNKKYFGIFTAFLVTEVSIYAVGCFMQDMFYLIRLGVGSFLYTVVFFVIIYKLALETEEKNIVKKKVRVVFDDYIAKRGN